VGGLKQKMISQHFLQIQKSLGYVGRGGEKNTKKEVYSIIIGNAGRGQGGRDLQTNESQLTMNPQISKKYRKEQKTVTGVKKRRRVRNRAQERGLWVFLAH